MRKERGGEKEPLREATGNWGIGEVNGTEVIWAWVGAEVRCVAGTGGRGGVMWGGAGTGGRGSY